MDWDDQVGMMEGSLASERWEVLDSFIISGRRLNAVAQLREWFPGTHLYACEEVVESRRSELKTAGRLPPPPAPATLADLRAKIEQVDARVAAIEAYWDGDTRGWFVVLSAIVEEPSPAHPRFRDVHLTSFSNEAGDMRLFNGQVPPWPEAAEATELGSALAGVLSAPFYFTSPESPDDPLPRWWDGQT